MLYASYTRCRFVPEWLLSEQVDGNCEWETCGGSNPYPDDHSDCEKCNGGYPEPDNGEDGVSGCDDDECKACSSGICKPVTVSIDQITEPMCEGETRNITGSNWPVVSNVDPGLHLGWTTDTPNLVTVSVNGYASDTDVIAKEGIGFSEANVVGFYKNRGQCGEAVTSFEILPKKTDSRIGDIPEQYDFLEQKCTLLTHDSSKGHPVDGCSGPGIQSILGLNYYLGGLGAVIPDELEPLGPEGFSLYQPDSDGHAYPIWGEDLRPSGDIPDSEGGAQTLACNVHDICYQTCGNTRNKCDVDLGNEGRAECKRHYPGAADGSCPSSVPAALCPKYFFEAQACSDAVTLMYDVAVGNPLEILSGEAAFQERQVLHCNCCGN